MLMPRDGMRQLRLLRRRPGQGRGAVHRGPAACAPAQPRRSDRKRARSLRPASCCREKDQMRRNAMTACPNPTLHTVEGAPTQALADLLRTATDFDEIARHLVDEYDLLAIEIERIDALRAAVRALNEPLAPSRLEDAHSAPATLEELR